MIYVRDKDLRNTTRPESILVVDICDSRKIGRKYGDNFIKHIKERVENIMVFGFKGYNCLAIKDLGDGFMATFEENEEAVRAAIHGFSVIERFNESDEKLRIPIELRFAIHFGEVYINNNGDRQHNEVSMTFTIRDLTEKDRKKKPKVNLNFPDKNRILISAKAYEDIKDIPDIRCKDLGFFKLKGSEELHPIYQIQLDIIG